MNKFYTLAFFLFSSCQILNAQTTGSFQKIITHSSASRVLEYYVPTDYNPANAYPLVVGMHGCVGGTNPSSAFRNAIRFFADSIGAIVVCPNGIMASPYLGMMDDPDHTMILTAMDTTLNIYNIDTSAVYLTGFSCNGYVTAKYGTRQLYNWKGIITIHAAFIAGDFTNGSFDYTNTTKTCICIGSLDAALSLNEKFRDSLDFYGSSYYYNLIPGVGHTTSFPAFKSEMMECMNWINGVSTNTESASTQMQLDVYPNPATGEFYVEGMNQISGELFLTDMLGRRVAEFPLNGKRNTIDISSIPKGIYSWTILSNGDRVSSGKIIVE